MNNPIPIKARGWILVLGIIVGIMSVVIGPLITALHISVLWAAVIISAVGAFLTLTATLSRANLADPPAYSGLNQNDSVGTTNPATLVPVSTPANVTDGTIPSTS